MGWQKIFLLAALSVVLTQCALYEEDVLVMTNDNFKQTIEENDLVMVEFYAPWCGHCKNLAPEYAKAAGTLKEKPVVLAKVDATVETQLGAKYVTQGYPTIKVFSKGVPTDYNGGRQAGDIVSFLNKQLTPPVQILADAEALEKAITLKEGDEPIVVAYTHEETELGNFFSDFAKANRNDFQFGLASPDLAPESAETLVLYKPYDELKNVYNGAAETTAFKQFLVANSFKAVDEISPKNYKAYIDRGLPLLWLFHGDDEQAKNAAIDAYRAVAPSFRQFSFVYVSGTRYNQMVTQLGFTGKQLPVVALEDREAGKWLYPEGETITADGLRQFLTSQADGSLAPHVKSEDEPANLFDEHHVAVLVGKNFKRVAMEEGKDVLVEFYAPWCGHCKALIPVWNELATELKNQKDVIIAKTDATANDYPGPFRIQSFPTLKLIKADNTIVDGPNDRSLAGIKAFLKQNAVKYSDVQASSADDEL